jgi:NTE family protein
VLAGLQEGGLDVTAADRTVGTSAGSTAAAQLTSAPANDLYSAVFVADPAPPTAGGLRRQASNRPVIDHLARMTALIASASDAADLRRRVGEAALGAASADDGSWQSRWRAIVASRLPGARWPERGVLITALDARTGEPVVFDRGSGVDIVDAVAASCASGLPYGIGDGLYLDGGFRSGAENADLAAGCGRVLVLAPFGGQAMTPVEWGMHLSSQVDGLRAGGSRVEVVAPGGDIEELFGPNAMDGALRPAAARAGFAQGRALVDELTAFWR